MSSQNKKSQALSMGEIVNQSPLLLIGLCGGLGSSTGELVTFGFDNIKTRMQMNGKQGIPKYDGLLDCIKRTFNDSGIRGFYRGFSASVFRQMTYSTVRIAVYEKIKREYMTAQQQTEFIYKFLAGGVGGAIGCVVGTPGDIIKIRLINDLTKVKYSGFLDCFTKTLQNDGAGGFLKGLNVNITRAILVNASELSAYDQAKSFLVSYGNQSETALTTHFLSSTVAGFFGAVCSSPADVVKTRYMNQSKAAQNLYKSGIDCTLQIAKNEGMGAFYKGFLSYFLRIAPWNVVMFMSYEQYKNVILRRYYDQSH